MDDEDEEFFDATGGSYTREWIDDPREVAITQTGLLDSRGIPFIRVSVPIKQPMGFVPYEAAYDEVEVICPEDELAKVPATFHPDEVELGDEETTYDE